MEIPCRDKFFGASSIGVCGPCQCAIGMNLNPVCNKSTGECYCNVRAKEFSDMCYFNTRLNSKKQTFVNCIVKLNVIAFNAGLLFELVDYPSRAAIQIKANNLLSSTFMWYCLLCCTRWFKL